jgi:hypothetical protein
VHAKVSNGGVRALLDTSNLDVGGWGYVKNKLAHGSLDLLLRQIKNGKVTEHGTVSMVLDFSQFVND